MARSRTIILMILAAVVMLAMVIVSQVVVKSSDAPVGAVEEDTVEIPAEPEPSATTGEAGRITSDPFGMAGKSAVRRAEAAEKQRAKQAAAAAKEQKQQESSTPSVVTKTVTPAPTPGPTVTVSQAPAPAPTVTVTTSPTPEPKPSLTKEEAKYKRLVARGSSQWQGSTLRRPDGTPLPESVTRWAYLTKAAMKDLNIETANLAGVLAQVETASMGNRKASDGSGSKGLFLLRGSVFERYAPSGYEAKKYHTNAFANLWAGINYVKTVHGVGRFDAWSRGLSPGLD